MKEDIEKKSTSRISGVLAVTAAVMITVFSGVIYARMSQQWGVEQDFEAASVALSGLPQQFGDWHLEGEHELGDSAMELLQCRGFIHHSYRNDQTGQLVNVAVMVGPGSKMSIHVPEICFEAKNYSLIQERQLDHIDANEQQDSFWTVAFQLNDVSERRLNVYYGWKADQGWVAPRMPRWSVAGYPVLFKLQLSEQLPASSSREQGGAKDFLRHFLPVLNARLEDSTTNPSTSVSEKEPKGEERPMLADDKESSNAG